MDDVTMIRTIAGALAITVFGIIVWRRNRQASE